jgi:uncharacterized repeat protein (TIGR01451 family)
MRLVLEPRLLFDASVGAVGKHAVNSAHAAEHESQTHAAPIAGAAVQAESTHAEAPSSKGPTADPPPALQPSSERAEFVAPTASANGHVNAVLFVDPRVSDWQELAQGIAPGTKVVVLDEAQDGLKQVSNTLSGLSDVRSVDFLTYGQAGKIDLGAGTIDTAALMANAGQVAAWRDHLTDNAQIRFWGCDVGAGAAGAAFVDSLYALTGVGIAASTDATGTASLAGNWDLERTAGGVIPGSPFSTDAIAAYRTVLDSPVPTVTLTGVPSQILLGGTFSETATFTNTAANGVGFGPFIDVFAPANALDTANLSSATYLGLTLPVTPVTLSTDVPGHVGTLGALHPLSLNILGNPAFVTAPPGAQPGDHLYVIQLPFGSFAPGQPAADITLNFQLDPNSVLTSQHAGQDVDVSALGGFIYGADALNNPAVDKPLRGTAGNTPLDSTPANGLVTANSDVTLVDVSTSVVTNPGEGESATGPDFVEHYLVTLTPAPATSGNPISGLDIQVALPGTVQYTGDPITVTGSTGTATFIPAATPQGGSVDAMVPSLAAPGQTVIDIPIFVPQTDASGANILDPTNGTPATISGSTTTYDSGTWIPGPGSADAGMPVMVSGSATGTASFIGKSFAVQVSAVDITSGTNAGFPGDEIQYTTKFQLSDFFNISNLAVHAQLDDGLAVDPTVAAVLTLNAPGGGTTTIDLGTIVPVNQTVNGEVVPTLGSNANWSFSRDNGGTGDTSIDLAPAAAIAAALGSSVLAGGETGTLTFRAQVLDKFTNSHVDPFTGAGGSITELDSVTSTVSASGMLVNGIGIPTTLPPVDATDNSGSTLTVPQGAGDVFVAAINGVAVPPGTAANIAPGESVTYGLTYNLVTGDYRSLSQSAFLPLPVVSVTDPAANGSNISAFTEDPTGNLFPAAGQYRLVAPPPGVTVASANVDAVSNGITFDVGHRDDTTNTRNQQVTVYFSFVVTDQPFADGLDLTAQGQSGFTNSSGSTTDTISINEVTLQEPDLSAGIKTGTVSVVGDAGTPKPVQFAVEGTGVPLDPTILYDPAGTSGDPFKTGTFGPATAGDVQNLNVAGADGADTVRVIITVGNNGSGPGGAYDVIISNTLPTGYTTADISNLTATRSGTLTSLIANPSYGTGSLTDLFTVGGVMLEDPTSTAANPNPTLFTTSDALRRDVLTIAFDLKLHPDQPAGATLVDNGQIVNFTNVFNGVALGFGFVVNGQAPGGGPLNDQATIATTSPDLSKVFGTSDIPQDDNADAAHPNATVVIGETRLITVTVGIPEGSIQNNGGDVLVTEQLPAGEIFRNLLSITGSSGVTLTPSSVASVNGQTVTFDLGPLVSNTNADAQGSVNIVFNAYFSPDAGTDGTLLPSTANLVYSGAAVPPASVTFVEHDPNLSASLTDDSGGSVFSNRTINYTFTIANSGIVESQATVSELAIPSGLTYVPGSLRLSSQSGSPDSVGIVDDSSGAGGTISVSPGTIDPGGTITYTFSAVVKPNLAAGTDLTIATASGDSFGESIASPQAPATARIYPFSAADALHVIDLTPQLFISGEANGTSSISSASPVTSANAAIGDILRLHGELQIPEGQNANVILDFALPTGFVPFVTDGTVTLALISEGGIQFAGDSTGTIPGLQVHQTTPPIDATTFTPSFVVPSNLIDLSVPGHLRLQLGTVTDNFGSALPNFAVVEFNGFVANTAGNNAGASLAEQFSAQANGITSSTSTVTETVREPSVDLSKTVTAISPAAGAVTYQLTLANNGDATAYALSLSEPLPSNATSIANINFNGAGTGVSVTPDGSGGFTASLTLAAGATETFSYILNVSNSAQPVPPTTTTETFRDLDPAITLAFGSAVGASGSAGGSRDGSDIPGAGINDYWRQVTTSLSTSSGQVWQALGNTPDIFDGAIDTRLPGVTVTIRSPGPDGTFDDGDDLLQTTTTGAAGNWLIGLIPDGQFRITLPASGNAGLPSNEALVVNPFGNLTTIPATATATAVGAAITGVNFAYEVPDTAPVLGNWASGGQLIDPLETLPLSTTGAATVQDSELDHLVTDGVGYSYSGAVLTVQRYSGGNPAPDASDQFGGDSQLSLAGGVVSLGGTTVGTVTQAGGTLSITLGAGTDHATVEGLLDHLSYSNSTIGTVGLNIIIGATLTDGNVNDVPLASGATGKQGTGGVHTSAPIFSTFTLSPGTAPYQVTFTEPNDAPAQTNSVTLPAVVVTDSFSPTASLSEVRVQLRTSPAGAEDVLSFTNDGSTMGDIVGTYDPVSNTLRLTSPSMSATISAFRNALAALVYVDTNDQPHAAAARDVVYAFVDASTGVASTFTLGRINVSASDDSPILDSSVLISIAHAVEDGPAPVGTVGTLVSSLVGSSNVADPDGANAHDGGAPGPFGLAITTANTSVGSWWYSTDNGVTWARFAAPGLTPVSDTNALHLSADDNTRIFFQATQADFNGSISPALAFRAWDQSDGAANGSFAALPTGALGVGINTPNAAYSAAVVQISVSIDPVNDAPIASGTAGLVEAEDVAVPVHATVGSLFAANFSDRADQQVSGTNPTGSVANTLAGVAITGDVTPAVEGVWRYSLDGGASWIPIGQGLSASNALVLSASVELSFAPAANFNGQPLPLTVQLIDSSHDVAVSGGVFGSDLLAGGPQAIAGVDVSGAHSGGNTAVSAGSVVLLQTVTPVNDAPTANGSTRIVVGPEDQGPSPSRTILTVFAGTFSDSADQQRSLVNPTGSVANALAGVAVVGNTIPTDQGVVRYSVDGGATWTVIGTDVTDANALVLSSSTLVDFVPAPNFNGVPGRVTVRLIDSSTDVPVSAGISGSDLLAGGPRAIAGVDVSGGHNGGITALSAATAPVVVVVTSVNDAPIASGSATLGPEPEDTGAPAVDTVGNLFAANFSDAIDQQGGAGNAAGSRANVLAGVAVIDPTNTQGVWRYSLDQGQSWTDIPTNVSDTNALVLSASVLIEFAPAADFNGAPPPLMVRLIGSSSGVPLTGDVTGADLLNGPQAIAGVDVSGSNNGGNTSVSVGTVPLSIQVTPVNDAPIASGTAQLVVFSEDQGPSPSRSILTIFAGTFSDTADQQQSVDNPTGSMANALAGVAVVGNTISAAEGVVRYSLDGGSTWTVIGTDVTDANALILSASILVDFVPTPNFNGLRGHVTVRLIDSSSDVAVSGDVFGSGLLSGGPRAIAGVDVSGPHNGGITALSAGTLPVVVAVVPSNDAPIASGAATLGPEAEDTNSPAVDSVGNIFAGNFSDTADQPGNPLGSQSNLLAGVAVVSDPVPASEGVWRYSLDGGASWSDIPITVSDNNALVLSASVLMEFVPVANFNGLPPPLTVRLIDSSSEVAVSGGVFGSDLLAGGPRAITGVDVSDGHNGGTTAVSVGTVPLSITVTPVNDAPIANGTIGLVEPEDTTTAGNSVASLFGSHFSDTADQQRTALNPTGSVANVLAGVAITQNTTPVAEGVWRYSLDGGASWTDIPPDLSDTNALVLTASTLIEFVPTHDFNGAVQGGLTARLIDSSSDVAVSGGVSGSDLLTGAPRVLTGVDVSGGHNGGITAVSAGTVPLSIEVTPMNDAPLASGAVSLPPVSAGSTNPPSDTVLHLFAPTFSDAADQQRSPTNPTGSLANVLAGIVVVGNTTTDAIGTWRYSTDDGRSWIVIPNSVSDINGLLLGSSVRLAFFPSATFSGTPPPLIVRLVDSSSDVPIVGNLTGAELAGQTTALAGIQVHSGGITAVSAGTVTLDTTVTGGGRPIPPVPPFPPDPFHPPDPLTLPGGLLPGWLVGSSLYRTLITEERGVIAVTAGAFYGSDPGEYLTYEATTIGGGPLPPWLTFDPLRLIFTGTPPDNAAGTLDLVVIATDQQGRSAGAEIHVVILRDTSDLFALLRAARVSNRLAPVPPGSVTRSVEHGPGRSHIQKTPPHAERQGVGQKKADSNRGLSAQLREHALAGRLVRARALLNAFGGASGARH